MGECNHGLPTSTSDSKDICYYLVPYFIYRTSVHLYSRLARHSVVLLSSVELSVISHSEITFGHISYHGLQLLLANQMVDSFNIDINSPKPDCIACMEAKQHVESFLKTTDRKTEAGELTHIDLWGKYTVKSIHSNQYYLLFVDDAKRFITINFIKEKSDAAQCMIDYLAHLITQGHTPKAIQIDQGKEFVNEKLQC
jgi:hypothetical protein